MDKCRIKRLEFRDFLAKRYGVDFANKVVPACAANFGNYLPSVDFNMYCDGLESIFNKDEKGLKEFAFRLFDVSHDKKLSQNDIFELMLMTDENMIYSTKIQGYHKNPNYLKQHEFIPLNKVRSDLFLEIF